VVWSSQEVEMACSFGHLRPWLHMTPTTSSANFTHTLIGDDKQVGDA
jgi:hypothetical protein